jgi:hypothetical protein
LLAFMDVLLYFPAAMAAPPPHSLYGFVQLSYPDIYGIEALKPCIFDMGLVRAERFSLVPEDPDGSLDIWFYANGPQSSPGRESFIPRPTAIGRD